MTEQEASAIIKKVAYENDLDISELTEQEYKEYYDAVTIAIRKLDGFQTGGTD